MIRVMTDDIRGELRAEIARQGKSMAAVAREIDISRNHISHMLSKQRDNTGDIPAAWSKLLDHLGYELKIVKKDPNGNHQIK